MPGNLDLTQFQNLILALFAFLGIMATIVGPLVKSIVDIVRQSAPGLKPWAYPLIAILTSFLIAVLILMAVSIVFTLPVAAFCVLAAIIATIQAVGTTETQNNANDAVGEAKRNRRMGP